MSQPDDGTGNGSSASEREPKVIVVFSDGTGNSAARLQRTNVWRLYQTLDTSEPTPAARAQGARQQIAYYDDGVGTSSFRPLALLGGVFGWGLKRNVLDLYTFLCRNYKEGDEIYAFGFSRGAFTIRLLVGLLSKEGLLSCTPGCTEEELARYAPDAYRAYRRDLTRRHRSKRQFNPWRLHVFLLRMARDKAIGAWRWLRGQKAYDEIEKIEIPKDSIAFVGVWDTVAAYGTPFAELTHGIDHWVWPLSMPDCKLSKKVKKACHALALDDERDTFHPLLWSEIEEQSLIKKGEVRDGRLQQVWFAGMHCDVGGGYADDGLAHVALQWMMQEAESTGLRFDLHRAATQAAGTDGLRYDCHKLDHLARDRNSLGPLHDSRRGMGGYYRYQPRRISALLEPPDPATRIMRNPDLNGHGLLTGVKIHQSVIDRIRSGPDHYAPIVLPAAYQVVGWDGTIVPSQESPAAAKERVIGQEAVWNEVWKKRIFYFLTVGASLVLAALPLIHAIWPPSACVGPQCLLTPVIAGAGDFLPGFVAPWITAFGRTPGAFLGLAVGIAVLLGMGAKWQRHVQDQMRRLWVESLQLSHPAGVAPATRRVAGLDLWPDLSRDLSPAHPPVVPGGALVAEMEGRAALCRRGSAGGRAAPDRLTAVAGGSPGSAGGRRALERDLRARWGAASTRAGGVLDQVAVLGYRISGRGGPALPGHLDGEPTLDRRDHRHRSGRVRVGAAAVVRALHGRSPAPVIERAMVPAPGQDRAGTREWLEPGRICGPATQPRRGLLR